MLKLKYYTLLSCWIIIATYGNTLRHTETHCNTLQHTAKHCDTLQHTATRATANTSIPSCAVVAYLLGGFVVCMWHLWWGEGVQWTLREFGGVAYIMGGAAQVATRHVRWCEWVCLWMGGCGCGW